VTLTSLSRSSLSTRAISPALLAAFLASTTLIWPAAAQQADSLPTVQVSPPKKKKTTRLPRNNRQTDAKPKVQQTPQQVTAPVPGSLASANPEASRVAEIGGIAGAPTTVITSQDIAHSPGQTVQDILATQPGIQLQSFYGGVNGVGTSVDLRGFGAFATANTLVLINGRRVNDIDLAGVDYSTIPLQSIDRIEITRGNSGAVLYGDNAVGGVINIITKTGAGGPPVSGRVEAGVGSFGQVFGNASATTNYGPWSTSTYFSAIHSDGYRANNKLDEQAGSGDIRYTTPDLKAYFNVSGDNQSLGLPGTRSNHYTLDFVNYFSQLGDLRGSSTPFDYADKQGVNVTSGFTKTLTSGVDFIVDGGLRRKTQQAGFFGDPASPFGLNYSYVDTTLDTWSITPRLSIQNSFFGFKSDILAGIDYYNATYDSSRSQRASDPPNHIYNLSQQTLAAYWQQKLSLTPATDFSYGGRIQYLNLDAKDHYDPLAPFGALAAQATPLNTDENHHALNVGLEHRLNDTFTLFARAAQAFRTPNVDERVVTGPAYDSSFNPIPQNFALKTQTSYDIEGGVRIHSGPLDIQTSYYDMHLKNEIHYNPVLFYNYNLDPTHRYGTETYVTYRVNDDAKLKGSFTYIRAVFEEGQFAGNDIPLVSRFSGSAGVSWNVWQKYVVFDATLRAWSSRRMDNDQPNTQPKIPANATVDLKLSGEYDRYYWSASLLNAFDTQYYDYAIASASTPGAYAIYPLPGRSYLVKIGANF